MTFLHSDFRLKYNNFRQLWHHNSWKKFTSPHKLRYTKNWLKTSEIVHQHQISSFLVILFLASNRQNIDRTMRRSLVTLNVSSYLFESK